MADKDFIEPDPKKLPGSPEPDMEKLNLAQAPVRRRNMLGSEIILDWNRYTAQSTALCSRLVSKVSSEAGASKQPDSFNVSLKKEYPGDLFMEPTIEVDESTIQARWSKDGKVRLYLERLLTVNPLAIPQGMRAHIDVSRHETKNGPVLRIHFSEPRLAEIRTRTRKKKSDDQQQGTSSAS